MLSLVAKLAALNEAARDLSTAPDMETLLDRILGVVHRVFELQQCAVLLQDPSTGELFVARHRGYKPDVAATFRARPGEGITGTVFATGRALLVGNVSEDPRYVPGVNGAVSEMAAPLRVDSTILGVLDAETRGQPVLSSEDLELFAGFAAHAGTAIHNLVLRQDLAEQNRALSRLVERQKALIQASILLQSDLNLDHILDGILDQARSVLGFQACAILLAHENGSLQVLAATGYPDRVAGTFIPKGRGVTGRVMARGEPVLVRDVGHDPDYIPGIEGGRCEMAVPMTARGSIIGVLDAESPEPNAFDEADLELFGAFAASAAAAIQNAQAYARLAEEFRRNQEAYYATIHSLAQALEARDAYTRGHSERVARLAVALAKAMSLPEKEISLIEHAALLHDIGKIGIRDEILNKPGSLDPEDRRAIEQHPLLGDTILEPLRFLEQVQGLVRHHHERYDGTGYPDGLAGDAIPLPARIVAVADAFDAMTSRRPYRKAMSVEHALRELQENAGTQFDPEVVRVFVRLVREGTIDVLLETANQLG